MAIYALDGVAPVLHPTIRVGARTSVQDGAVLPTTEQWPTLIGDDCAQMDYAVAVYVENARRYREKLVRLD